MTGSGIARAVGRYRARAAMAAAGLGGLVVAWAARSPAVAVLAGFVWLTSVLSVAAAVSARGSIR